MPVRYLVVDDEPMARRRIVRLMASEPEFQLVRECRNGAEALDALRNDRPDLIFLDIRMPGLDGFEVVQRGIDRPPYVIFVTGYERFAARAFDVHAIDYLVKPFEDDRFRKATARARELIQLERTRKAHTEIHSILKQVSECPRHEVAPFRLKHHGTQREILAADVCWIEADDNYMKLHQSHRTDLVRGTLQGTLSVLDSTAFVRVHRSKAVHLTHVEKIVYHGKGEYRFKMSNGDVLTSSRSYTERIRRLAEELERGSH